MVDDDSAGFGVDFVIDAGDSLAELGRLVAMMESTEAKVLGEAQRIEKATAEMVDTGAATAGLKEFANEARLQLGRVAQAKESLDQALSRAVTITTTAPAATGAAAAATRERNKTEQEIERLIRSIDRETAAVGRSREEQRAARVEQLALTAAQQQNGDAADRLYASYRALTGAQAALAEDRALAQALREQEASARTDAASLERLRASTDPLGTAVSRLNDEIAESTRLFNAGRTPEAEYAQQQQVLAGRLREAKQAHDEATGATGKLAITQRFTAMETLNLSRQLQDIGVTAAMGMNPFMILVQQGPQIYDVLEQAKSRGVGAGAALAHMGKDVMQYAVTGFTRLIALATPVNLLLAGTAMAAAFVARSIGEYGNAIDRFEATAAGLGRLSGQTAQQLEGISEAAAALGERSLSASRDSVDAFAAAGIQGERTLTLLAANVERYAKLTGQDVPAAQKALADAMSDPAKAADMFTQQLGLLTGAQYEHIQQLVAQGDQDRATSELTKILTDDLAANAHQTTGLAHYMDVLGTAVSGVSTWFGRLDQRIRDAGASYDSWLRRNVGGWAVDLIGTGNRVPGGTNPTGGRNQSQVAALRTSQAMDTSGMRQFNDLLAKQSILQKGLADTTGLTAAQVQRLRHDYTAVTDTIAANRTASGEWITTQERAHLVAQAQARLAGARTQREKAAAQQTITQLQLGSQVLTQQERQTQAVDAYNRVASRYVKPKVDRHADTLAREAEATKAQIRNLYSLASAYETSGAAALIAEARVKAESAAIKKKADVEEYVAGQVRLTIAQRVSDAAKGTAQLREQAAAQEIVNAAVAQGNIPGALANELLQDRLADLPLLAAIEAAKAVKDVQGIEAATKALEEQRDARNELSDAQRQARLDVAMSSGENRLAELREELRLVGATDAVRSRSLAVLRATQEAEANGWAGPKASRYVEQAGQIADGQQVLIDNQRRLNQELTFTADRWDAIAGQVQSAAQGMADAFGSVGRAIGDLASSYAGFEANRARLQQQHDAAIRQAGTNEAEIARENHLFALRSSGLQVQAYGDMAAAAKGFFKEGTSGYQALQKAEQVFRAVQFAMSVRAIAQDAIETGSSLAKSAARTAANAVEAVTKAISSLPFPLNLAAGAATVAALASIGVAIGGSFGGGGSKPAPSNTGTGTVLGDPAAQSQSIARSIDQLKAVDTLMLAQSREMAASLRSIDAQIGGFTAQILRAGDINASAGVNVGFKGNLLGGILAGPLNGIAGKIPVIGGLFSAIGGFINSLFGSTTKITGNGLFGGPQSLSSILGGGFDASYYSDIEKTSKFLGIKTGTSYSTKYTDADPALEQQFTLILRSFNDAIGAAAGPLGVATADIQSRLAGFVVDIGKIDLKGLTGEQIQEKLSAVFGAAADRMAEAAIPGLSRFQKAGEGAFETLVRVASTVETVTSALEQMGGSFATLSIDAKMGLAGQFDSLGDLQSAVTGYLDAFFTPAERAAAQAAQLGRMFTSLGITAPATMDGYRKLVEAQDLTTAAGQATYAALLQLAPAFADLQAAMNGAKSAADALAERQDLERRLLELQGKTAEIRALDLAKLDASNRALQEQIWAIEDAQEAARAANELRQAWTSVGDSIMDEVKRIRGLDSVTGDGSFASLMGRFNELTIGARAGDKAAAEQLPEVSRLLLQAAGQAATSRQELDRIQAETAASLEATFKAIAYLAGRPETGSSAEALLDATAAAPSGSTPAAANDDLVSEIQSLRAEVAQLRSDTNAGNATIAANTGRAARVLEDVSSASGGEAISVAGAA